MNDMESIKERIIGKIEDLRSNLNTRKVKVLQIDRFENIVNKLCHYSDNCNECSNFLKTFEHDLLDNMQSFDKLHLKKYMANFKRIVSHLCKKHKHVIAGSYWGTFMSLGMSFGMSIGLMFGIVYDKAITFPLGMSLGMSFGMTIGMIIGSLKDASEKKKGNVV